MKINLFVSTLVFLVCVMFFSTIFFVTDITLHYRFVIDYLTAQGSLPANFLYYYIISLFTMDVSKEFSLASVILLSFSVVLKYHISIWYIKRHGEFLVDKNFYIWLGIALLFVTPLYIPQLAIGRFYLGSFTATVWHNSTTIALLPFAVMLFALTINQLLCFRWDRLFIILILIGLNSAIKPSYLFVYIGAIPLTFILINYKNLSGLMFAKQILPAVIALLIIILQKYLIYETQSVYSSNASIEFVPFKVYTAWHSFGDWGLYLFFLISVALSILFPLFVVAKKGLKVSSYAILFSIISFVGALLVFVFFTETGERSNHGNFFWQIVPAAFILFLVTTSVTIRELSSPIKGVASINAYQLLFALHVIFGLVYFLRIAVLNSYT